MQHSTQNLLTDRSPAPLDLLHHQRNANHTGAGAGSDETAENEGDWGKDFREEKKGLKV